MKTFQQVQEMGNEAIWLEIAQIVGWTRANPKSSNISWIPPGMKKLKTGYYTAKPPQYQADLNACWEIEKLMTHRQEIAWRGWLESICLTAGAMLHSTARQRCEAFILATQS